MRFHRLDLIKYGKFSDRSIELPAAKRDFHLIIGPNEAGKSTLRSAILDVLFGIPRTSPLSFLHPLNELRLGAQISNASDTLEFQRAKANKNTLRTVEDAVLPEDVLAPFTGTADRSFFDQMFGLDHSRLVDGGNSILNAESDVGQILFQSAAGIASLGKIRDELIAEADKLWSPRKSAERAYYIASDLLDKANATLKDVTVRTKVWADANSQVELLHQALTKESSLYQQLLSKRNRLERIRRLAPFLIALRESEKQLGALGEVIDLPEDAATTLATAERELAIAGQRLELRNNEVEKASVDLKKIHVDDAVLDVATEITKLDELRLQYNAYARDIEQRELEIANLWREICAAAKSLSWKHESIESITLVLPTLLHRRELMQLARDKGGLLQTLKAAEQAAKNKVSDIKALTTQLADLQSGEIKPALRAALAKARALGDPDSAIQKQQAALNKAKAAANNTMLELGQWRKDMPDLIAMQPPSSQTISGLLQERQTLLADRRATLKRLEDQTAVVAETELQINQFNQLHHPITSEAVFEARRERDIAWSVIKSGESVLQQGAQRFEDTMLRADSVADTRFDNVEEATILQSLLQQLEREKQNLSAVEIFRSNLDESLNLLNLKWTGFTEQLGLTDMPLENIVDWLTKREKALAAAIAVESAQSDFDILSKSISECHERLTAALRDSELVVAESDSLSALCIQADIFIQTIEGAGVRRETLTAQLRAAEALEVTLQQAITDAQAGMDNWTTKWTAALTNADLPAGSDIGTVAGALELIDQIDANLSKIRQIQVERIDTMKADLNRFSEEVAHLSQIIDPDLKNEQPFQAVMEMSKKLAQARESFAEATRLKTVIREASAQALQEKETMQTAQASLKPLMERARIDSNALLSEAIERSDTQRRLNAELDKARTHFINGGDGLSREDIEAEIDATNISDIAVETAAVEADLSDVQQRQRNLSVELANAERALSEIGGSDAAALAEAQRQEAISQMSDTAERYVKVFTAGRLLRWSIDRYREEKQGPLLGRASTIFSNLTLGSFRKLVVDFEKEPMTLEGQRSDGKLVSISGMSDGTRDQLYLALRLAALELHLQQATSLPFIADDLFINYDDARSKAGLEALATLSEKTQVIFLSHHDHLVPTVQEVFGNQINVVAL